MCRLASYMYQKVKTRQLREEIESHKSEGKSQRRIEAMGDAIISSYGEARR